VRIPSLLSKALAVFGIGFACVSLLESVSYFWESGQTILLNGVATDTTRADPTAIEREIRAGLPLGSSQSAVELFLSLRGIRHNFDAQSQSVYAGVREVRGTNWLIEQGLGLRFHFDSARKLNHIDAKVELTGS
jgi:hypothetical protein